MRDRMQVSGIWGGDFADLDNHGSKRKMRQGCQVLLNVQRKFGRSWIFRIPRHLSANIPIRLFDPLPMPQYPLVPLPVCRLGMVCDCQNYILLSRHEVICRDKLLMVLILETFKEYRNIPSAYQGRDSTMFGLMWWDDGMMDVPPFHRSWHCYNYTGPFRHDWKFRD